MGAALTALLIGGALGLIIAFVADGRLSLAGRRRGRRAGSCC